MTQNVDLVVRGDVVMTMSDDRLATGDVVDGAVVIDGDRIIAVTTADDAARRFDAASELGGPGSVVVPGLVNAHQHLTGDRLIRSTIPDDLGLDLALERWALPSHAAHTGDMDELSATLSLLEAVTNGITFTVEAGTVAHPERVLAAFDAVGVGGTLGSWGWDVDGGVHAGSVDEVIDRQRASVELTAGHDRVHGWVTLVGHDLMTDDLVARASDLARSLGTGMTFHMSPSVADSRSYRRRTGKRPLVHLASLGALGRSRPRGPRRAHRRCGGRRDPRPRRRRGLVPLGLPSAGAGGDRFVPPPAAAPPRWSRRARLRQRERR